MNKAFMNLCTMLSRHHEQGIHELGIMLSGHYEQGINESRHNVI